MKKLKLAFVGGGLNSAVGKVHFVASSMDSKFEVVAGCFSRHNDINIETANEWNIDKNRVYGTYQELFKKEYDKIDAVVVLTPSPNHTEVILEALDYNISVISEKSLTYSVEDALKIKEKLNSTKGFLGVIYNYTGYPMLRELRKKIELGEFGKINHIQIEMPQEIFVRVDEKGNPYLPQKWRRKDRNIPIISLDLGIHLHNMVSFLVSDKCVELVSNYGSFGQIKGVIDNVSIMANYESGMNCNIWYSKCSLGNRNGLRIRVFGEKYSAEWFQMNPEMIKISDWNGKIEILDRAVPNLKIASSARYNRFKAGHPDGFLEAFANYYDDLYDVIFYNKKVLNKKNEYIFNIDDALDGLKMLEAVSQSVKEKRWILLG